MRFLERSYTAGHWTRLFVAMAEPHDEPEEDAVDKILLWCVDQFGAGGPHCAWEHTVAGAFTFHDMAFATAFKLRWMTSSYEQRFEQT
jgi:hypothetical protein